MLGRAAFIREGKAPWPGSAVLDIVDEVAGRLSADHERKVIWNWCLVLRMVAWPDLTEYAPTCHDPYRAHHAAEAESTDPSSV